MLKNSKLQMLLGGIVLGATIVVVGVPHAAAQAIRVPKHRWIDMMKTGLPAYFCQEEQYFRSCFEVTQDECETLAASTVRVCLKSKMAEIPEILTQPKDGRRWGRIVGACAGRVYENVLKAQNKIISNERCKNWLPPK